MTKKNEENLPVNWEEQLAAMAQAEAAEHTPSNSNISFRGGIVHYEGQPVPENSLSVVIVGSIDERVYYEGDYDPDNLTNPTCFALTGPGEEAKPHDKAARTQSHQCEGCPMNEWGSGNRGRGKACKEKVRLAMIPADVVADGNDPEKILGAEVAVAKIPVMSVKNWSNYVRFVAQSAKRPTFAVVTTVSAAPDPKSQFKVEFNYSHDVDLTFLPALQEKMAMADDILHKPYDSAPSEPVPEAKGSKHKA